MRKPNCECSVCGTQHYVRPNALIKYKNHYCSKKCYAKDRQLDKVFCPTCNIEFRRSHNRIKFCSRYCAHRFPGRSINERRLNELKSTFEFDSCMVDGCPYNKTYDIHRLIHGKDGGQYIIGNMFAICPNHHAEVHRKVCKLIKVSDCQLKADYGK
jgi:hypothetical protein